jgi:carbon-monoxide dehydrogenase medium subunit
MKAAQFDYHLADSLADAHQQLAGDEPGVKVLGGSQSLGPMLNMRLARPSRVVDVTGVQGLGTVSVHTPGYHDGIRIGAAVTHAQIEDARFDGLKNHPIRAVAADIAYRAVRNRGTVGGSLVHADPAADWVVALTALDATVHLSSAAQQRDVSIHEFFLGAYATAIQADEVLTGVSLPALPEDLRWGYVKFCRKPGEFAHASAAVRFEPSTQTARIVVGALDGPPQRLDSIAGEIAGGQAVSRERLMSAVSQLAGSVDPVQHQLHAVAIERALVSAGIRDARPAGEPA